MKRFVGYSSVLALTALAFGPLAANAQTDWSTSTTNAITSAQNSIINQFFTVLPYILGGVVAVTVTLWGIKWILGLFRRR